MASLPSPSPLIAQQPLVGLSLLIIEASRLYSDTPQLVRLLWTGDQPDAVTYTCQHTALTTVKHLCLRRDSHLESQQARTADPHP